MLSIGDTLHQREAADAPLCSWGKCVSDALRVAGGRGAECERVISAPMCYLKGGKGQKISSAFLMSLRWELMCNPPSVPVLGGGHPGHCPPGLSPTASLGHCWLGGSRKVCLSCVPESGGAGVVAPCSTLVLVEGKVRRAKVAPQHVPITGACKPGSG